MTKNTAKKLAEFQRELYDKAFAEARSRWTVSSPLIKAYASDYLRSLPKTFQPTTAKTLLGKITENSIVLYGDFHTLKQSQKGLVRLLQEYAELNETGKLLEYARLNETSKMVLALEMFRATDQPLLDKYQNGLITEAELLKACNYYDTWGFPYKHYKIVLDYALEHHIKIYGINTRHTGSSSLERRDEFMSRRLYDIRQKNPGCTIFCMVGEYHLADQHLPGQIAAFFKQKKINPHVMRIFTNIDEYYFKEHEEALRPPTEYLYLKLDHYCILNSPPWVKWQSYLMWEELQQLGDEHDDDEDILGDEEVFPVGIGEFDLEYQLFEITKQLAKFLSIPLSNTELANFSAIFTTENELIKHLEEHCGSDEVTIKGLIESINQEGYLYFPVTRTAIFTDLTLNNLGSVAGQVLQTIHTTIEVGAHATKHQFCYRVLRHAAGMVASKILNPRRKGHDIWFYRALVTKGSRKRLTGKARRTREIGKMLLKIHEQISRAILAEKVTPSFLHQKYHMLDASWQFELSKAFGEMLGFTLYTRTMSQTAPPKTVRDIFQETDRLCSSAGILRLYELVMH